MYNFFVSEENRHDSCYYIFGSDYNHIVNVLRMQVGDEFLVSDNGQSHLCRISNIDCENVVADVVEKKYRQTELGLKIYLFQGLPKSDKMELIIQKTVELGVNCIIPVEMSRCVVNLDDKKKKSKVSRWQAIAESAAKQSKRNIIPEIKEVMTFNKAVEKAKELDMFLIPYENKDGMSSTLLALKKIQNNTSIGIFIGPEGGFDEKEIAYAVENSGQTVSLGKRILRTETAAITSVGMCMLYSEIMNGENNEKITY